MREEFRSEFLEQYIASEVHQRAIADIKARLAQPRLHNADICVCKHHILRHFKKIVCMVAKCECERFRAKPQNNRLH